MRWQHLTPGGPAVAPTLPLAMPPGVARTFDTPGFAGMTFYEVRAKTLLNRVPPGSRTPFEWTLNPYRGCSHACVYCFARGTHRYLELDPGLDFDTRIVVKVNAGTLLRRELAAPGWSGAEVAMGTNVDCYQRVEGRYRLMREVLAALRDFANPFSLLTKGTLVTRDIDLLQQAAEVTSVRVSLSVGFLDESLWRSVEPGAPSPRRRLDVIRRLTDAGLAVGVLLAPILPGLTDTEESLNATVTALRQAGATTITPVGLHLRPGAREWYANWLAREHPHLVPRYRMLYRAGAYLPKAYQRQVTALVEDAVAGCGRGPDDDASHASNGPESPEAGRSPAARPSPATDRSPAARPSPAADRD